MYLTVIGVTLLVVSSILVTLLSKRLYRMWINPISVFALLSLFHNWIGSALDLFFDLEWNVNSHAAGRERVLFVNLAGLWAFTIGALLTRRAGASFARSARRGLTAIPPASLFEIGYFVVISLMVLKAVLLPQYGYAEAYGAGQAAYAPAISKVTVLFLLRVPFLIIAYTVRSLLGQRRPKTYLLAVALELLIAVLSGGRKTVMIMLVALGLAYVCTHRIRFKMALRTFAMILFVGYLAIAIRTWRTSMDMQMSQRISHFTQQMTTGEFGDYVILALRSANSEAVQSWLYRLWYQGGGSGAQKMYGKTYVQALLNTFVPRQFQGPVVEWQAAYVFKGRAYRHTATHMGYDFAFTAEAMLNFGPYFAFISFIGLGMLTGYLFARWRNTGSAAFAGAYFVTLGVLAITLRTDSAAMFRFLSFGYIPLALISFFVAGRMTWVAWLPAYQREPEKWSHLFGAAPMSAQQPTDAGPVSTPPVTR